MNLEQAARLRQGVYRLLSLGFGYPKPSLIEAASGALAVLDDQGLFEFSFALDVAEAAGSIASTGVEELEVAYIAVFEAGVGALACSPYESSYRAAPDRGGVAEIQSELRRAYLRFGLSVKEVSPDMIDHIATELDVMALLCSREAEAWSDDPGRTIRHERELLEEHLLRWAPDLAGRVKAAGHHPAYTSLAGALDAFLGQERQWVPRVSEMVGSR